MGVEHNPLPSQHLDWILGQMDANIKTILKTLDVHGMERKEIINRVTELETKVNKAAGVLVVFSAFISVAAGWVWKKLVG